MPTLFQLQQEVWWNNEFVPLPLADLIRKLRAFYQVSAGNIGSKGDENHLRGYHRSRNWIKYSSYCTNRTYSVSETPGNRSEGNSDWLSALDITIPRDQLLLLCQRLDVGVRSGRFEKITEWYGNKDGDTRVDGYNNIHNEVASSDASHLWHCHISFDRGRVGLDPNHNDVYELLTGDDMATPQETWSYDIVRGDGTYPADNALWEARQNALAANQRLSGVAASPPLVSLAAQIESLAEDVAGLEQQLDKVLALLTNGLPVSAEVSLTDAALQEVADAVVNEERQRLED